MKNLFKQLGKVVCYFILFYGMQLIVTIVFMYSYIILKTVKMAMGGQALNPDIVIMQAANYTLENTNLIGVLSGSLTLLTLWLFFWIRKKKLYAETGIVALSGRYVPYIVLLGITLAVTVSFGLALLPESWLEAYAQQSAYAVGDSVILMVMSNMIMAPIVEEIIFRGLILSRLRKAMPIGWAIAISSLLFGLVHGQILWMSYAFVLGIIMSLVVIKTDSLVASIILHMVFNIFGTVVPLVGSGITSVTVVAAVAGVAVVISVLLFVGLLRTKMPESV